MTRALSELLGAKEPAFRRGLQQLEQASGCPSEDIRLSSEIGRAVQDALRELGLDPRDTTGPELYAALQAHLKHDDKTILELLGSDGHDENLMLRTQHFLKALNIPKKTFALKSSAAKKLLKKTPPKKAMKKLGYRSLDSMLKHEPVAQVYVAALIAESNAWHRALIAQYKILSPTDFEVRDVMLLAPDTNRWQTLSASFISQVKHNVVPFKELGAVVLLPLQADAVPGAALTTLVLAIHAINDIRTTSVYLKLHQVRPDFGTVVAETVRDEPFTQASLLSERLPWKLVQHYFSRTPKSYVPELFEPHVQQEDLHTEPPENILAQLHPRLEFWKEKSHLGLLHDGEPVSLNLADAALNFCNHLPYEQRVVHYLRDHLWRELMRRYMHQENLEQTVHEQLGSELVDQEAIAK